jgi:hypothetical protein
MPSQRYAVLIGNGEFTEPQNQLRPLRCPIKDVTSLAELLVTVQHGEYAVTTLVDATHDVARRAVYKCLQRAERDDLVLIYFSGHGKLDDDGNLYLVTKETSVTELPPTSFPVDDLKRYIRDSRVATTIVILDCCFSGAIEKLYKGEIANRATSAIRKLESQGTFYLTASTDTQVAEEKEGDDHSLLTKHIIAGIKEGFADYDDDGLISFQELCSYVQQQVPKEGKQTPRSWAINSAGNIIVAQTGKPAAEARRRAVIKKVYELASQELLTEEAVSDLLKMINLPPLTELQPNFSVKDLIESLYSKNTPAFFIENAIRHATMLRAPLIKRGLRGDGQAWAEEWRKDEETRINQEQEKTEEHARIVEQERERILIEERLRIEEQTRIEERRKAAEQDLAAEAHRKAEEARINQKRENAEELARIAEHNRRIEEEERILIEERLRTEEQARLTEERREAEEQAVAAEAHRKAEEARINQEKEKAEELARIAEHNRRAEEERRVLIEERRRIEKRAVSPKQNRKHRRGLFIALFWITVLIWIIGGWGDWIHGLAHIFLALVLFLLIGIVGSMD